MCSVHKVYILVVRVCWLLAAVLKNMNKMLKTLLVAISSQTVSSLSVFAPTIQRKSQLTLRPLLLHNLSTSQKRDFLTLSAKTAASPSSSSSSSSSSAGKRRRRKPAKPGSSPNQKHGSVNQRRRQSNGAKGPTRQNRPPRNSTPKQSTLHEPTVIFSNNQLLLVNKPAGYHSQPNESIEQKPSRKCLLSKLKSEGLGGGSAKNFLLPMHRLDQPCTGILLLAKNSKAGTRTGNAFRKHVVKKDYFCVVEGNLNDMMMRSEAVISEENKGTMHKLTGVLMPNKRNKGGGNQSKGGSVLFKTLKDGADAGDKRVCHLEWEHLLTVDGRRNNGIHLVRVVTGTGAKHQVRAMLSQLAKSPVCGDLRYGASSPLPDQSVALHARSLHLPTVSLGDTDLKKMRFVAPIPKTWKQYFSLREAKIPRIDYGLE